MATEALCDYRMPCEWQYSCSLLASTMLLLLSSFACMARTGVFYSEQSTRYKVMAVLWYYSFTTMACMTFRGPEKPDGDYTASSSSV